LELLVMALQHTQHEKGRVLIGQHPDSFLFLNHLTWLGN
jgi:hypothetical protein